MGLTGRVVVVVVFLVATIVAAAGGQDSPADIVLLDGHVVTVDPDRPSAEAIAVRDGRILAVGSSAEIAALAGVETERIDLAGATAVPGLIDAHLHFPELGPRTRQLFLDDTSSPEEALAVVAEQVDAARPGEWISGQGWHTVYWGGIDYPDKTGLDRVAPDNPVFLRGMSAHAAWVNSAALEAAGITADTPDPPGGEIVRDPTTGEPTGILLETAVDRVAGMIPAPTRAERKADLELGVETALRLGLTGVHDAGIEPDEVDLYRELAAEGALDVRVYAMLMVDDADDPGFRDLLSRPPTIDLADGRFTLRAVKVMADGALGARGAALLRPYADSPADTGLIPLSDRELYRIVRDSMEAGYQPAVHAIGDRANRVVLDTLQRAQRELGIEDVRPRIEHAQVVAPEDVPRFSRLGVIASMQPIHCTMDMGFAEVRLGAERMAGAYAWKTLLDSGAVVAAGSDTPAFPVHYTNPLWGIHAAVTRRDRHGDPPGGFYPDERVGRMQALEMYTVHAAFAAFQEDELGSLTPGKLADITVLSRNILEIPADELLDTEVVMTVVDGEVAYRR